MFNFFKNNFVKEKEHVNGENKNHTKVVYIHGANQSSLCWTYLREKNNFDKEVLVNYNSTKSFYNNLENIKNDLDPQEPVFLIGHSLGGIYALHLLKHCNVIGAVSISTPFRGSSAADWAKYIVPQYQLFRDVGRKSKPIVDSHNIVINVPWTQIVSTTGTVPYLNGENDGVCTVASMEYRKNNMQCVRIPATHYEVMVSDRVVEIIKERYNKVNELVQYK